MGSKNDNIDNATSNSTTVKHKKDVDKTKKVKFLNILQMNKGSADFNTKMDLI